MKSLLCLLFCMTYVFTSCSDDDGDSVKPVISLHAPKEGAELKIGGDIHFDMDLEDNDLLKSYKVEIHNNFDGHGHTKAENTVETVHFTFNKSWDDIAGKKSAHIHHHEIKIPENATPGNYHFMVYCTDASGNESYVARNIILSTTAEVPEH